MTVTPRGPAGAATGRVPVPDLPDGSTREADYGPAPPAAPDPPGYLGRGG